MSNALSQGPGGAGRGSWWVQPVGKPYRKSWAHGRQPRKVQEADEDGSYWTYRNGCGASSCGLCHAVDRAQRGPLCGFTAADGSRCRFWYGHVSPGDSALCPPHVYDHLTLPAEALPELARIVGFDPFAPEPAPSWVRNGPLAWNDPRHPWTMRPEVTPVA